MYDFNEYIGTFSINPSEYCCGLYEIGNFRLSDEQLFKNREEIKRDEKAFSKELDLVLDVKNWFDDDYDDDDDSCHPDWPYTFYTTVNLSFQKRVEKILKEKGFKEVVNFINPNTESNVKILMYVGKGEIINDKV